jgi:hypothetical protein
VETNRERERERERGERESGRDKYKGYRNIVGPFIRAVVIDL